MKTIKFSLLAAASALVLASGAQATTTDWATHGPIEIGVSVVPVGSFTDWFKFEIAPVPFTVSSTAVANNLGGGFVFNVAGGQYSVWSYGANGTFEGGAGDDVKLSGNWAFNGASGNITNSVALSTGKYYYQVTGQGTGLAGGMYTLTSTVAAVPVPEPETYAMMLAGLGALGFLASRRRG